MVNIKHLLTANELAPIVKMHPNSIRRLARLGIIRSKRVGGAIRFDEDEFLQDISKPTTLRTLHELGKKAK